MTSFPTAPPPYPDGGRFNSNAKPNKISPIEELNPTAGLPLQTIPVPVYIKGPPPPYSPPTGMADGIDPKVVAIRQPRLPRKRETYARHMVCSCLVAWLCGWLFGGIAFILAMCARGSASDGDHKRARRLASTSVGVSVTGAIVGAILWILLFWLISAGSVRCRTIDEPACEVYTCNDGCYEHRSDLLSNECLSMFEWACYSWSNDSCYYNDDSRVSTTTTTTTTSTTTISYCPHTCKGRCFNGYYSTYNPFRCSRLYRDSCYDFRTWRCYYNN